MPAKNYPCGNNQGAHLSTAELCWVVDKNFYGLGNDQNKQIAVAIALAESGGYTGAVGDCNSGYSLGLWQIHVPAHPVIIDAGGDPFNAYDNAGMAAEVYRLQKFKAWSTYKDNSYQSHMTDVTTAWPNKVKPLNVGSGTFKDTDGHYTAPIIGSAQTVVDDTKATAQGIASIGVYLGKGAAWIGNPHNWLRIAFVGLGAGVVIAGLAKLVGVSGSDVAGVVPGGSIAAKAGSRLGSAEAGSAKNSFRSARSQARNPSEGKPIKTGSSSSLPKHHPARKAE